MIEEITSVRNFGIFQNFRWPSTTPRFKKRNLLYGWNYSGKTTLSRILRALGENHPHPDFPSAQAEVKMDDGSSLRLANGTMPQVLRIFNSDFVRDNLKFDTAKANPILVLGAEDIEARDELAAAEQSRSSIKTQVRDVEKQRDSIQRQLNAALTNAARDVIKTPLGVPDYDKRRFERAIKECQTNATSHLLSPSALRSAADTYRSAQNKQGLPRVKSNLSPFVELARKVADLVSTVVAASRPLARLASDAQLEKWVNDGRHLHIGKDRCQFCDQPLPIELLDALRGHFSLEYDRLMTDADELVKQLKLAAQETIDLFDSSKLFPELVDRYVAAKSQVATLVATRQTEIKRLIDLVESKRTSAFTRLACPEFGDQTSAVTVALEEINKLVAEHNRRVDQFDEARKQAFQQIERHHAAEKGRELRYDAQIGSIEQLGTEIASKNAALVRLEARISELRAAVAKSERGASKLNELLAASFGRLDLRISVDAQENFQILRGTVPAANLSEGEKTAIAFAYFITLVHDGQTSVAETIAVVDDPISSLDSNHLFNTFALIKTKLADCRQLFILTHSFELYALVRDWALDEEKNKKKKPQSEWSKWTLLLIRRISDRETTLIEIPKELLLFKSEYHYLFSKLLRFDRSQSSVDDMLGLPNLARRFLEAFCGIMIPRSEIFKDKLERLIPDEIERERVWKFVNEFSHNRTLTRSLAIPDISECSGVIRACLNAVRSWNSAYYQDMLAELGDAEVITSDRGSSAQTSGAN